MNPFKRSLLLCLALCLLTASACAAAAPAAPRYVEIFRDETGVGSLDLSTIEEQQGFVSGWIKIIPRGSFTKFEGKQIDRVMLHSAADLSSLRRQTLETVFYAKDGSVLYEAARDFVPDSGEPVIPATTAEAIYKALTNAAFK